jgi:flagellar protein FliL
MSGGGKGGTLGLIVGTVLAVGGGFGFGAAVLKKPPPEAAAQAAVKEAKEGKEGKEGKVLENEVRPLSPIITNLGNPSETFVRLQAAVILAPNTQESNALIARVNDDVVAYLRTVSISELQGPTGFQYLREDMKKRAIQLGGGKIKEFLITSFVVE